MLAQVLSGISTKTCLSAFGLGHVYTQGLLGRRRTCTQGHRGSPVSNIKNEANPGREVEASGWDDEALAPGSQTPRSRAALALLAPPPVPVRLLREDLLCGISWCEEAFFICNQDDSHV